ncbi:MAG: hypothetical protein AAF492_04610 [Verrucomicrobiota bacterium]
MVSSCSTEARQLKIDRMSSIKENPQFAETRWSIVLAARGKDRGAAGDARADRHGRERILKRDGGRGVVSIDPAWAVDSLGEIDVNINDLFALFN